MNRVPTIAIIDPKWHGLGYVDAVLHRGYRLVAIAPHKDCPKLYGYADKKLDLIIAQTDKPDAIIHAVEASALNGQINMFLPGNDYYPPVVSKVSAHFGLPCEPYDVTMRARHKDLGREAYDKAGIPNPKWARVKNIMEAIEAAHLIGYPLITKPTDDANSDFVKLVNNDDELANAITSMLSSKKISFGFERRQVFLLEEFVAGQEFSVELFLHHKEVRFASVTEKISSQLPYFVELGHVVPTSVHGDQTAEIINTATKAVFSLGFSNGPFHVELRLSPRGPVIMETNGRIAGDMIALALLVNAFGVNLYDVSIESYLGHSFDATPKKNLASSIAFFTAKKDGKIMSIEGVDVLKKCKNIVKHHISAKIGDVVKTANGSLDRLGYVIATAATPQEAKESAFEAIKQVGFSI